MSINRVAHVEGGKYEPAYDFGWEIKSDVPVMGRHKKLFHSWSQIWLDTETWTGLIFLASSLCLHCGAFLSGVYQEARLFPEKSLKADLQGPFL